MPQISAPSILIVDDEAAQVRALCDTLKESGYQTVGCTSATEALATLQTTDFDLVLTDLMMPEMNGIELLQAALKARPNLVGLIMTGEGTIATAVAAMKSGAFDYVLKPFKLSAILPVLDRALAVRRLRTENVLLAQRVQQHTQALEFANQELEAFSYSVSHDLRAPLRHISAFSALLIQSERSLSEEGKGFASTIATAAARMQQLIDDLLNFARNSRAELRPHTVELRELFEGVIASLVAETKGRNVIWKKGDLPQVQADPGLLRQVVTNLLLNAVKYTRPRNPAEIEYGCLDETAPEQTIFVRDNGVGFDMKYADKLFGAFQRLHPEKDFEGTGVGLANVRRIIARHGGRTWAEGKVNAGATFYFTLPKSPGSRA